MGCDTDTRAYTARVRAGCVKMDDREYRGGWTVEQGVSHAVGCIPVLVWAIEALETRVSELEAALAEDRGRE